LQIRFRRISKALVQFIPKWYGATPQNLQK
jgi:hypothetical protein